jgi:hypothetical protein
MAQKLSEYGQVVEDPLAHFKAIAWCEAIMYVLALHILISFTPP